METKPLKVKISGTMIANARKAEEVLARQQVKNLDEFLPEGHPLKEEAARQKSMLGGDLNGLPPGHPLLRALEAAKRNYEAKKAEENRDKGPDQSAMTGPRKAKRPDKDATRKVARRQEDEMSDKRRAAAMRVNKGIERVLEAVRELRMEVSESEEILNNEPFSRTKTSRLKRLVFAAERGVSECRIARF